MGLTRELTMKFKFLTFTAISIVVGFVFFYLEEPSSAQIKGGRKITEPVVSAPAPVTPSTLNDRKIVIYDWRTVVNNGDTIPGTGNARFSSYGQPSVNSTGSVVFRARSTGGQRATGIFIRHSEMEPILKIADLNTEVPYPNNLNTTFQEFSAIPRIAPNERFVATRGLHKPVYRYLLPDGTETRAGTNGLYVQLNEGLLITAESKLGKAPGFDFFSVPNYKDTAFDVFPGAPTITDEGVIAFKGNYTVDGIGKTGVFTRRLFSTAAGGNEQSTLIASSDMEIPNMPPSFAALNFDSTSPPTAFGDKVLFLGLDNEDDPNAGGIYSAFVKGNQIEMVIGIGDEVPGTKTGALTRIGEALAYDGRYVTFWGAWGKDTFTQRLYCPVDGNRDIINYCNGVDPHSVYDEETNSWYQDKEVPLNQGIFLFDTYTNMGYLVADNAADFNDFVYWTYSGHVPAPDEPDAEPPRWRSSAFAAMSDGRVVFKARTGALSKTGVYVDPVDGLYLGTPLVDDMLSVIVETGMEGSYFDPNVSKLFRATLPVVGFGIERDGFRGNMLAVTISMADEENSWGGIYLANVGGNR